MRNHIPPLYSLNYWQVARATATKEKHERVVKVRVLALTQDVYAVQRTQGLKKTKRGGNTYRWAFPASFYFNALFESLGK